MAYVRTRLGRMFYEEHGTYERRDDRAIVLLHGLLFDGGMWKGQAAPLGALGRVIVIDGPGHGRSEPPPQFTLEEHAEALFDALGELGVRRAVLVGLSWGGMLGMRFALQHPAMVAGLALLDSNAEVDSLWKRVKYRGLAALHRRVGTPNALYWKAIAPLMFGRRTLLENRSLVDESYQRMMRYEREGLTRAILAVLIHRKDILRQIAHITAPTLVMCGKDDLATPPERSRSIARAIPGANLVVLPGLGHMSALEDAAAVNAHLVPFVRECVERMKPEAR
jgi:3-oxoadipate enol-lactonase